MQHPFDSHEKRFEIIEDKISKGLDRIRGAEESTKQAHLRISESEKRTCDKFKDLDQRITDREDELRSLSSIAISIKFIAKQMEDMKCQLSNEIGEVKKEQKKIIIPKLIELENKIANKIASWTEKIFIGGVLVFIGYLINEVLFK